MNRNCEMSRAAGFDALRDLRECFIAGGTPPLIILSSGRLCEESSTGTGCCRCNVAVADFAFRVPPMWPSSWMSPRVSAARVRSTRYTSRPWCCECWTREMTAFAGFRSVHFLRAWGWQAWVSAFCPTVPRRLFPEMGARPVRWGRALVLHGLRRACGACGAPATHARVVTGRGLSGVR